MCAPCAEKGRGTEGRAEARAQAGKGSGKDRQVALQRQRPPQQTPKRVEGSWLFQSPGSSGTEGSHRVPVLSHAVILMDLMFYI